MLLIDILKKFTIDENNKELEYLVIYFVKESVMDMASDIAKACDNGQVEEVELEEMNEIAHKVEEFCK